MQADMTVLVMTVMTKTNMWSCNLDVIAADLTCLHIANSISNAKTRVITTADHKKG